MACGFFLNNNSNKMDCLKDFIGILGCTSGDPDSGLYINSLPGIPLESIDKIANADQVTYLNVWESVQNRALRKLEVDTINVLSDRFRLKNIRRVIDLGRKIGDTIVPELDTFKGIQIKIDDPNSNYTASSMQYIYVDSIAVYVNDTSSDIAIFVIDADTLEVLYTDSILLADFQIGWNEFKVNELFDSKNLQIVYSASLINSAELEITPLAGDTFCGCCNNLFGNSGCGNLSGVVIDEHYVPVSASSSTSGLTAKFSLQCKYDGIVCQNKNLFSNPLLYLLGVEMMNERIFSPRHNFWTFTIEAAEKQRDYYMSEYQSSLVATLKGIDINLHDVCVECDSPITITEATL